MSFFNQEPSKEEKEKKRILKSGVVFFMLLIGGLWFLNVKEIIGHEKKGSDASRQIEWEKMSNEFNNLWDKGKEALQDSSQKIQQEAQKIKEQSEQNQTKEKTNELLNEVRTDFNNSEFNSNIISSGVLESAQTAINSASDIVPQIIEPLNTQNINWQKLKDNLESK
ncbi:MAG: hypothetical protein MUF50_01840 [Planctomycetes bacterium]|jgi:ElaB/YqjD/DUF883 family membrane-anchored ribosome-binding protein|nr:hypothetical protein [Planctomycetota bacterium]